MRKSRRRLKKVQMRGGARRQPARRTFCTLSRLPRAPTKQMGLFQHPALDALEVAEEFPVSDGLVERLLLEPAVVQVVLDDFRPEGRARRRGSIELVEGLPERLRHLGERRVLVRIALVEGGRLELLRHAVKARGDGRGEGKIGVRV